MGSLPQLSILRGQQVDLKPCLLHRIIENNIHRYSSKLALINPQKDNIIQQSYNELNQKSNKIARHILFKAAQNSLRPNSDGDWIIAICMVPSCELITILLAIWKTGAAYLPIDPSFPRNRIQHILNEAQPFLTICDENMDKSVFGIHFTISFGQIINDCIYYECIDLKDKDMLPSNGNPLALILYTSGSTGIPKGVRLPHSIILNRLQWQWDTLPYPDSETVCVFKTAITFVDSVSEIWSPLLNGLTLLILSKNITKDPDRLSYYLEKYKIERLVLVPTLLRSLLMYLSMNYDKKLLYRLKSWICSGETLPASLVMSFFNYFQEGTHILYNFYGSTEVMGDVTYYACSNKKQIELLGKVPIGHPINNTVIYLLDSDYRPVKIGQVGEIFISGQNLAEGYVNGRDPHRFIENPLAIDSKYSRIYRTGDYGILHKGMILYEGRTDSQIKVRGHRVDLMEIEKNILSLPDIDKAIALCYHPGEIDQSVLAFVTLKTTSVMSTGLQIENYLKDKIPNYMLPQVILKQSIPLLVNGKIDRQTLLETYQDTNNNEEKLCKENFDFCEIPPHQVNQAHDLFEIIANVIGKSVRTKISKFSNFYELGGNSLNSIYTVTKLREHGYLISITDFINSKNLGEILEKIVKNDQEMSSCTEEFKMHPTPLCINDKSATINIITSSFYGKADLEQWLKPDIFITDYADIIEAIWDVCIKADLSFMVRDSSNTPIGVALNFDAHDEPEINIKSKLSIVFEFLEFLEGPLRDNCLPQGLNKVLHSSMMGTSEKLSPQANIAVMNFMENETINVARRKGFTGVLTTNTNPLTQQLGSDIYNYRTLLDFQVNQYVASNGTKPFENAPDSQRAIVHWKDITHPN